MHAAAQHLHGTMAASVITPPPVARPFQPLLWPSGQPVDTLTVPAAPARMTAPTPRKFYIQGVTSNGRAFRPSDWAERLAGALSSFRPKTGQQAGIGAHIGYSPYCVPRVIGNVKCVIVNEALRDLEPMAWDFVMHFARDNDLQVVEAYPDGDDKAATA